MRATRQRALRAAFKAEHGRAPEKTLNAGRKSRASEWRRVKKGPRRARQAARNREAMEARLAAEDAQRARRRKARAKRRRHSQLLVGAELLP